MGRKRKSEPDFDPEEEMRFERAFGEYFDSFPSFEDFLRASNPLQMRRSDFHDDEQMVAWERALRGIGKGSRAGLLDFLNFGKPLSPRVSAAVAYVLSDAQLAAPNDYGELERTVRIEVNVKSARPAHRPPDPATWDKVNRPGIAGGHFV